MERLKGFQRKTVNYAFRRMYEDAEPATRFLVADEVGLGKTQVAKGLIARVVAHKAEQNRRMDIIYICSNASIAAQNLSRLRLKSAKVAVRATRLTLLPLALGNSDEGGLEEAGVNFISFTPGTSFETRSRGGLARERVLIHRMLQGVSALDPKGLAWVLRGGLGESWKGQFDHVEGTGEPHAGITREFIRALRDDRKAFRQLTALCQTHARRLSRPLDAEERAEALEQTTWLRRTLAHCCLKALKPDLVVLDEFQRFRELLKPPSTEIDDDLAPAASAAQLAQELFNHENQPKVLLLSATPYKMFVAQQEKEDHYRDFLATAGFLFNDAAKEAALTRDLAAFRAALVGVGDGQADAGKIKQRIEAQLKQVMCRTERVGVTRGRDAMVRDVPMALSLTAEDLADYACVDALARASEANDVMEFWRSSPYLLNFMREDGYTFKSRMLDAKRRHALGTLLARHDKYRLLKQCSLNNYAPMVAANPRLDVLAQEMRDRGSWRLLWVPPSLPYWKGEGAYTDVSAFSKTLVFSSWNMVPDAVAGLLSYHAEQLAMEGLASPPTYDEAAQRLSARLRFSGGKSGHEDMNALSLMFPSHVLATLVDPLAMSAAARGTLTLSDARTQAIALIEARIARLELREPVQMGPPDVRWYWLTLLMLEREQGRVDAEECWGGQLLLIGAGEGEDEGNAPKMAGHGFSRHVAYWGTVWEQGLEEASLQTLGPRPADIAEVIADLALAGPAVCALRALLRLLPESDEIDLRLASVKIADVLRRQLNMPEAIAIIKHEREAVYWRQALTYCAEGNLQAMLDEYLHLLHEETASDDEAQTHAQAIAAAVGAAGHVRASQLHPEGVKLVDGKLEIGDSLSMRCRYAMRYGNATEDDKVVARKDALQKAFNSPFRPFVLASTSVGQEGLDFHSWCHSIVHWNLPGNPVDLEQREGRVHRYKGLAVRRNVARLAGFQPAGGTLDPWQALFKDAERQAADGPIEGLVPYWICEAPGGAAIERRVFHFPLSQDQLRFERLKSSLALYRMVFAQPRQQDLLGHLQARSTAGEDIQALMEQWRIELLPD
jgi:hypothetical protein